MALAAKKTLEEIAAAPVASRELAEAAQGIVEAQPEKVLSPDAPIGRPRLVNPLEPYVKYIEEGQQYLDAELIKRLRMLLPEEGKSSQAVSTLDDLLPKLSKLVTKMHAATISSTDTKELRDVFNASKDMIKLIASMQERLDAEKKLAQIEGAIIAACDAIGDEELKERFLSELKIRLEG